VQARLLCLCAAGVVALAVSGAAAAAPAAKPAPKLNLWIDTAGGYSIALPVEWYVIPRTTAAIRSEIATLKRQKNTTLAAAYTSILDSPLALKELPIYRFQAFFWPPLKSLIPTEVDIQILPSTATVKYTTANLESYAVSFARSLQGVKAGGFTQLKLPAGTSAFFEGTVAGSPKAGLEFYFFAHKGKLYILSFELGDAYLRQARIASTLRAIASAFSFRT
jgi:hypothetical protein